MKLELKHLAGYLPYGLKGICTWEHLNKDFEVELYSASSNILNISSPFGGNDYVEINEFKPILRTLSDLTKEIEHNGEKFIPCTELDKIKKDVEVYRPINFNSPIELLINTDDYSQEIDLYDGYLIIQKLLECHFDIFGLIDSGQAIDINTLNK